MKKLHLSIVINAPKEKVWETIIGEQTYPQWTEVFSPGSTVKGDWSKGSKMLFLSGESEENQEGMVSIIAENRPNEFLSIKHIGQIKNGVEDTESEEIKAWTPAFENYTLKEVDGGTEFTLDMDSAENFFDYMQTTWKLAITRLKQIAEGAKATTITVATIVQAPMEKVWAYWNEPDHIKQWAFALDSWEVPKASNDVRVGGTFSTTMAAKDGSVSFDFAGVYSNVVNHSLIEYDMADGRHVTVQFMQLPDAVYVNETFDIEQTNTPEQQREGWQAILNNFKKHVETA